MEPGGSDWLPCEEESRSPQCEGIGCHYSLATPCHRSSVSGKPASLSILDGIAFVPIVSNGCRTRQIYFPFWGFWVHATASVPGSPLGAAPLFAQKILLLGRRACLLACKPTGDWWKGNLELLLPMELMMGRTCNNTQHEESTNVINFKCNHLLQTWGDRW